MTNTPLDYFRIEAHEHLERLLEDLRLLRHGDDAAGVIGRMMRTLHTLKGAARVVRQKEIAELSHALETLLNRPGDFTPEIQGQLTRGLEQIAARVRALRSDGKTAPQRDVAEDILRIDAREMDGLLFTVSELRSRIADVKNKAHAVGSGRKVSRNEAESLHAAVEKMEASLKVLRECADDLRLFPFNRVLNALKGTMADAAQATGKKVELEVTGAEIRMDAAVLGPVSEALHHLVRNAVVHGIEPESVRKEKGKPPAGKIRLRIESRRSFVHVFLSDDGQGLNLKSIREVAVGRGLLKATSSGSFGVEDAAALLLKGGVSTASETTEIAGRGVGLSSVAQSIQRAKGQLEVSSEPDGGTRFELRVPASVESFDALQLESGSVRVLVPLERVVRIYPESESGVTYTGAGATVWVDGKAVPFAKLSDFFAQSDGEVSSRSTVIIDTDQGPVAIGAAQVIRTPDRVMRPLPTDLRGVKSISGASLDIHGDPVPVIDVFGLADAVRGTVIRRSEAPARKARILVVDDSLTTRMLEKNVLEQAGFEVDLAATAEEALEKARIGTHSLFVIDVEMPGMSGIELTRKIQNDPQLKNIGVVMLSSRGSVEDRAAGLRAGARAYLVKSEFNEADFLKTVRRWIG